MNRSKKCVQIFLCCIVAISSYSQNNVKEKNIIFLDSLDNVYGELCSQRKKVKLDYAKYKIDKNLIKQLNVAYGLSDSLTPLNDYLSKQGFVIYQKSRGQDQVDTIVYYKHAGNLRGFVFVKVSKNNLLYKKIIIATNSHFSCPTEDDSLVYNEIDFLYVRALVKKIKFPLKVSSTNFELESK